MPVPSIKQMTTFLESCTRGLGWLTRLQMVNRPRICPFEDLLAHLPPGRCVLEIGCGRGTFLALIAQYRTPRRLMGLEVDTAAAACAKRLLARFASDAAVSVATYDGGLPRPEIPEAEFVFMVDVLHHIPRARQKRFLQDLGAAMQPGTTFILKDMDAAAPLFSLCNALHDLIFARQLVHAQPATRAANWLHASGFDVGPIEKRRRLWYAHYTIIARKG